MPAPPVQNAPLADMAKVAGNGLMVTTWLPVMALEQVVTELVAETV